MEASRSRRAFSTKIWKVARVFLSEEERMEFRVQFGRTLAEQSSQ
jgi:hypothetical protein